MNYYFAEVHMKYIALEILCRLENEGYFSAYKGSMLRGVLGNNLRRAVCVAQKKDCTQCMLVENCLFSRLFTAVVAPNGSNGAPLLPPPFCIEPDLDQKCAYAAGETFRFTLKLFSYATDYLPYFVHAFMLAGQRGMGRRSEEGYGRFRIAAIMQGERALYDPETERLTHPVIEELPFPALRPAYRDCTAVVHLLTPLRFKEANHLVGTLEFSQLLTLILRRIKNLCALDGKQFRMPAEAFHTLMQKASDVQVQKKALCWRDWSRYSGRQQTLMRMGGLTGRICYYGPMEAFADYFNFACKAHIGKQSSFGLGAAACHLEQEKER